MTKSEIFALVAGLLGFIVDVAALIALLSGTLTFPSWTLFGSSPIALAVVTLFSAWYSILLIVYVSRQSFRKGWNKQKWVPTLDKEFEASVMISYLLCIPTFWLWAIVIWRAGVAAGYPDGAGFAMILFWLAGMMIGGGITAQIVDTIDNVVNPGLRAGRRQQ